MEALDLGAFDFVVKPSGGNPQANAEKLRQELSFKIEAFARPAKSAPSARSARPAGGCRRIPRLPRCGGRQRRRPDHSPRGLGRIARRDTHLDARARSRGPRHFHRRPAGLDALLPQLPAELAAPVLIVQHMPPIFTRSLADDLDRRCALRVCEAADGQPVIPGWILIAPGGRQMKVEQGDPSPVVRITDDPPENSCQPSVDYLFRSVADVYGRKALGVLMTGMGNDGAAGCRLLHRRGAACWPKTKPVAWSSGCRGNRFKRA